MAYYHRSVKLNRYERFELDGDKRTIKNKPLPVPKQEYGCGIAAQFGLVKKPQQSSSPNSRRNEDVRLKKRKRLPSEEDDEDEEEEDDDEDDVDGSDSASSLSHERRKKRRDIPLKVYMLQIRHATKSEGIPREIRN